MIKKRWVEEIIEILKIQKIIKKKLSRNDGKGNEKELGEQVQRCCFKIITNIDEVLQVCIDFKLYSVQLQVIAHIAKFSDLNYGQKAELKELAKEAWRGMILKSLTNKMKCI